MANWRQITLDKAILYALAHGFDDEDFTGWAELDPQERITCVNTILHHNAVGSVVFRRSFAGALWGNVSLRDSGMPLSNIERRINESGGSREYKLSFPTKDACDFHRQNMVTHDFGSTDQDGWLDYLRQNMPEGA